ncbi:sulfatase-like hydrolase/transferase [Niabella sp. W65]|nr:sulfatase-like hydrolase/transferase [Niabella sp. W65]MCH7362840.1 sulfatase-like hydrolase/transferase [Niabella sp. W65]ULT38793.1 sulfatase-like hydrolase/transferase [Niabella sp. I65]
MNFKKRLSRIFGKLTSSRFSTLFTVLGLYVVLSFLTRIIFLTWSAKDVDLNLIYLLRAFLTGFIFDMAIGFSFLMLYAVYLLLLPKRGIGSLADKVFTYFYLFIILFIIFFGLMAEFPFWDEFGVRFNFIAVDYLIYTYEVVSNINQSYPLPTIIAVLLSLVIGTFFLLYKKGVLRNTFSDKSSIRIRAAYFVPVFLVGILLLTLMKNKQADFSNNLVVNELGKNGVFSFFAAFRSNELDYDIFYPRLDDKEAYTVLKKTLLQENQQYTSEQWDDISRRTTGENETRPNIILVSIESFSGDFLKAFGNNDNITPNYDNLAEHSIFFTNLYATGTRTVRGMEALTLCVPPTPGNSIVRRPDNQHLYSIATILKKKIPPVFYLWW